MITISNNLVLTAEDQDSPIFGWHNLVTTANITATSSNVSFPITNVANPSTNLVWKTSAPAIGTVTIDIDTSAYDEEIDYLAIARHNFGSSRTTVSLYAESPGGAFPIVITEFTPADDSPIILRFNPQIATKVRLVLRTTISIQPYIGVIYVGKLLVSPRRVYVGHTPINFGRVTSATNGRSENGNFLGRIITRVIVQSAITLQNLNPAWYRSDFDPFLKNVAGGCFFVAWRPTSYPSEVGYVWLTNDPQPVNSRSNGMMEVNLQYTGIVS